jgi:acetyl-CoA acetyltransferase
MSYGTAVKMPPASRDLRNKAAIVGVGETDFHLDYQAARAKAPGYELLTAEGLAVKAFERALTDSGLQRSDLYGGPSAPDISQLIGVTPRHMIQGAGIMAGTLPVVCADIAAGKCDTVAMIYAVASRSAGRVFGGTTFDGGGAPSSYYYHHPWGWSSQAAHWAFIWSYYQATYGATEADLGAVALQLRRNAGNNPNAVMQKPLTIEDYLKSRYVVRPLHLLDMCLVNDGGVCLIVRRADRVSGLPHTPVLAAGWGEGHVKSNKFDALVRQRLRPQMQEAGAQAFAMAGVGRSNIQHFEGYDAASIHLIDQVEGYGFAPPGTGLEFCKAGEMAIGGALPVNVNGGMLSGAYMHGWNHVAEITRQLRHEAGARQIKDVEISMFSLAQTDQAHPLIFMRGE